jgi:hypothetical protein
MKNNNMEESERMTCRYYSGRMSTCTQGMPIAFSYRKGICRKDPEKCPVYHFKGGATGKISLDSKNYVVL